MLHLQSSGLSQAASSLQRQATGRSSVRCYAATAQTLPEASTSAPAQPATQRRWVVSGVEQQCRKPVQMHDFASQQGSAVCPSRSIELFLSLQEARAVRRAAHGQNPSRQLHGCHQELGQAAGRVWCVAQADTPWTDCVGLLFDASSVPQSRLPCCDTGWHAVTRPACHQEWNTKQVPDSCLCHICPYLGTVVAGVSFVSCRHLLLCGGPACHHSAA